MSDWEMVYRGAILPDGDLFFPERLSKEFLDQARKHMGSRFWSNQYMNIVIDDEDKPFKREWLKYYDEIPVGCLSYSFVDPAISQSDSADFTAIVVVSVDWEKNWYIQHASKHKITPRQIMDLMFNTCVEFNCMKMGIEDVAFQKVLVYQAYEEMERRNVWIPLEGIKPRTDKTKHMKILGLQPRFERGNIYLNRGLVDFENEIIDYAGERSKHDDIVDALASIEPLITYPAKESDEIKEVPPNHPDYERWYRHNLTKGKR